MEQENQQTLPHGYVLHGEKNRYVIDRVLGQGSFGITYLAKFKAQLQGSMGRGSVQSTVAIKEFFMRDMNTRDGSTGYLNDASQDSLVGKYRRAFVREARNLARLSHPGIVNVFEVIETNNTVYIVMEYIDGGSLDEHIAQSGKLSEQESVDSILKLCSAVNCMHEHRMLHLDIKPKNVMLDEDGQLYLIDFGLSKQYTADGEPESSTSIGLGTPGYAPSEQAVHQDGDKKFRATLDIYALGATLFKMLTGKTPPNATDVSDSVLDGDNIIPKRLKDVGVTDKLAAVVAKAMFPSSSKRYQSVTELESAIDALHEGTIPPETEDTELDEPKPKPKPKPVKNTVPQPKVKPQPKAKPKLDPKNKPVRSSIKGFPKWLYGVAAALLVGLIVFLVIPKSKHVGDIPALDKPEQEQTGTNNGHKWIDLGLSVKWATCNVGASSPSAYGDYYAWGETSTKSSYTWENYKYDNGGDDNYAFIKYCTDSEYGNNGFTDNRTTLELSDDAARQKWGGSWRMPTITEFQELIDNCTWTWTTMNGVSGYKVTSKESGYSSRSIFLPAAGCRDDTSLDGAGELGYYWSSSLYSVSPYDARYLFFHSGNHSSDYSSRYYGLSVRPVCP